MNWKYYGWEYRYCETCKDAIAIGCQEDKKSIIFSWELTDDIRCLIGILSNGIKSLKKYQWYSWYNNNNDGK